MSYLTKVKDTDLALLEELEGNDLAHLCNINRTFRSLCNEEFWQRRAINYIKKHYNWNVPLTRSYVGILPTYYFSPSPFSTWKHYYFALYDAKTIFERQATKKIMTLWGKWAERWRNKCVQLFLTQWLIDFDKETNSFLIFNSTKKCMGQEWKKDAEDFFYSHFPTPFYKVKWEEDFEFTNTGLIRSFLKITLF